MTKKILIAITVLSAILLSAWLAKYFLLDQSDINIKLSENVSSVDIYRQGSDDPETTLSSSGKIRLLNGNYFAIPKGDIVSDAKINFAVPSKSSISLDPDFSQSHLSSLLAEVTPAINAALSRSFTPTIDNYSVEALSLYGKGDWAGGLLVHKSSTINDEKDMYRFVARYRDEEWSIIGLPQLLLSKPGYESVPTSVVNSINKLDYELPE